MKYTIFGRLRLKIWLFLSEISSDCGPRFLWLSLHALLPCLRIVVGRVKRPPVGRQVIKAVGYPPKDGWNKLAKGLMKTCAFLRSKTAAAEIGMHRRP
jgi:hypothetical protein